jgi:hypothetical protein
MVDHTYWTSDAIEHKTFEVAKMLNYISLGFFAYECLQTFNFDLSILSGARQRKWAQVPYFSAKFCLWVYFVLNFIALWTEKKVNCQALYEMIQMQMGLVVVSSSFLLACRTICVFHGKAQKIVIAILAVSGLGLVASWLGGIVDVTSTWSVSAALPFTEGLCICTNLKSTYWVKYVFTIIFDFVVLVLTTFGIMRMNPTSQIGEILIQHGLIYFIFTFCANMVITVLTILQLSPLMSLLGAVPQATVCVLCSTRLYYKLLDDSRPTVIPLQQLSGVSDAPSENKKRFSLFRGKKEEDIPLYSTAAGKSDVTLQKYPASSANIPKVSLPGTSSSIIRVDQTSSFQIDDSPYDFIAALAFADESSTTEEGDVQPKKSHYFGRHHR